MVVVEDHRKKDHVQPDGKWQFDENVSACFADMLARSIPQLDVMRRAVTDLAARYVQAGTDILDLGCSQGDAIAPLLEYTLPSNHFYGIEMSEPMRKIAQNRFKIVDDRVTIMDFDLRRSMADLNVSPSVILSVLTMQFLPLEHRQMVFSECYKMLRKGGAFILVEKVLGASAEINSVMVDLYHDSKRRNGYTQEDIDRKSLSLSGVLVPVTAQWNADMLHSAGFTCCDCFWRWMNFAGWIAVKV